MDGLDLRDRADVFYKGPETDTGVVVGPRGQRITKPHVPMVDCQRIAAVCGAGYRVEADAGDELVTIERPGRDYDHQHTYVVAKATAASRARLMRLIHAVEWPTRQQTPAGWLGLSSID